MTRVARDTDVKKPTAVTYKQALHKSEQTDFSVRSGVSSCLLIYSINPRAHNYFRTLKKR